MALVSASGSSDLGTLVSGSIAQVAPIRMGSKCARLQIARQSRAGRCAAAASGSELIEQKIPPLVSWFDLCCVVCKRGQIVLHIRRLVELSRS